jgi:archaellum component FlaF (FlaF/FlaG flagellin family)
MKETGIESTNRAFIVLIVAIICLGILYSFHSNVGVVTNVTIGKANAVPPAKQWEITCSSRSYVKNWIKEDDAYRFTSLNSSKTAPITVFPFPKVFNENFNSAQSGNKLSLNQDYLIKSRFSHLFDHYAFLANQRFCKSHESVKVESSTSDVMNSAIKIQSIEIIFTNGSLKEYLNRNAEIIIQSTNYEAYALNISSSGEVVLIVNSEIGINHGLSTLSQLVHSVSSYLLPIQIIDWPESEWRGKF